MADWALRQNERQEVSYADANRGAANTKGSWVELIAATSFKYEALDIAAFADGGGGQCYLVDLAIGASGSEVVVLSNLLVDSARALHHNQIRLRLQFSIPVGSRLAVRCQEAGGSGTRYVTVSVTGINGGYNFLPGSAGSVTTYGADTAASNGTLIDPGAVSNTWGAWTEMTASSGPHSGIAIVLGTNKFSSGIASAVYTFQLAVGGSGSETVVCEFRSCVTASSTRLQSNVIHWLGSLPAGTRLAMRSKTTDASSREASAILLGY